MSDQMLYNAADDLLSRNITAGRGDKIASSMQAAATHMPMWHNGRT